MSAARVLVGVALAIALGCGQENAVLEMYVELPAAEAGGPQHALIQVRNADDFPFEVTEWIDTDELGTVPLGGGPTEDHVSIESIGGDDFDLNVRIRWCVSVGCSEPADDPTRALSSCVRLEHPFYLGERTEVRLEGLSIADATVGTCGESSVTIVDRCAIRGCVGGDPSGTYCRADGSHLCD